ncbi:hypothetical protein [Falsiroseomonas sp.]|uniref:hypothetical protein n=1 Tax=Falsiroseomonas sp. TaxID=2870721 RepID=UPI00273767E9|nr:hypothetical protein [Falsiroseomonas sp.]MDP3418504.1 hypothetical protein [Falsiroseomonas sp.]
MSATFRHGLDPIQPRADAFSDHPALAAPASGRLRWLAGLGALVALCLATALLLPGMEEPGRAPPTAAEALSLLGPRPPEPATLGGLSRALSVLERDLGTWQLLVAPEGRVDLSRLRARAAQLDPTRQPPAAAAQADPAGEGRPEPLADPGHVALIALAVTLAAATLLAGIAALLLERLLLAPYRALRAAAAGLAEGHLDIAVPGTCRDDEAGALARALERFRLAALATRQEARLDSMTLEEAGDRLLAASVEIERIAATAAARGLEASLAPRQGEAGRQQVAEGARQLAGQVVVIRDAADRASTALARMAQGVAQLDAPRAPQMARAPETVLAG